MSRYFRKPMKGYSKDVWNPDVDGNINIPIKLVLRSVTTKGKKLLFNFDNLHFVSSLGLEGHYSYKPEKHSGLILVFEDILVYYSDTRKFGEFIVALPHQLSEILKNVGPDYMLGEVPFELFYSTIRNIKYSNKEIVWFLMDQSIFSGVGNYIKTDALFLSKISPYRLLHSLSDYEIQSIYNAISNVMITSYQSRGATIKSYKDIDGNIGTYIHPCYGRKFTDEGYPIITCTLSDKRTTHWCSVIQK